MKNLDLNAYGVEEMNLQEMQNVEGGSFMDWLAFAVAAVCTISGIPALMAFGLAELVLLTY